MPTILTGYQSLDKQLARALRTEFVAMQGDKNRACHVMYFAHNLLGLRLTSEFIGANVSTFYRFRTLDLCSGRPLSFPDELAVRQKKAFQLEANRRLHQQVEAYIREHRLQGNNLLQADDLAGLRAQVFVLNAEQLALAEKTVSLPYQVSYRLLSNFTSKEYAGRFGPVFTFNELQAYLRPASPLRRLVLPQRVALRDTRP